MSKQKVIVGLSGGVDSSVAAYLLKKQGYDVHGIYMINWHDTIGVNEGSCPGDDDVLIAEMVARKLEIPFETVDFSDIYRKRVVDYMFSEYELGRTPNPDVLCNREVKFDVFLKKALEMGADFVATGHYCRKETIEKDGRKIFRLLAGIDKNKDQSYFLCQLSQQQLEKALFPIGELEKPEVREIAAEMKLASAQKKDSQGICFVGKVELPVFLQQKLASKEGKIIKIETEKFGVSSENDFEGLDLDSKLQQLSQPYPFNSESGTEIGQHKGAHFYTIGQRKGLGIGGLKEPPFVLAIDVEKNIVYVGEGKKHPGLFRKGLFIQNAEIHYVRPDLKLIVGEGLKCLCRIRYRQELQKAEIFRREHGYFIIFEQAQRGITAGQFAAIYTDDELIASGVINQ